MFNEIRESLSADIYRRGARIHFVEPLPTVLGERCQLGRPFRNLLTNALEYHRPGKPPRIRVSSVEVGEAIEESEFSFIVGLPRRR